LPLGVQPTVDDAFDQHVFVRRLGTGQHTESRPNLVEKLKMIYQIVVLACLVQLPLIQSSTLVPNPFVKFAALQHQKVLPRMQNAAADGNGPESHHT
jgi:hypothetical protein